MPFQLPITRLGLGRVRVLGTHGSVYWVTHGSEKMGPTHGSPNQPRDSLSTLIGSSCFLLIYLLVIIAYGRFSFLFIAQVYYISQTVTVLVECYLTKLSSPDQPLQSCHINQDCTSNSLFILLQLITLLKTSLSQRLSLFGRHRRPARLPLNTLSVLE
jgi:hypothetical protein